MSKLTDIFLNVVLILVCVPIALLGIGAAWWMVFELARLVWSSL